MKKKTPTQTNEQKLREKDANMEPKIIQEYRDNNFLLHTNRFVARSTRKKLQQKISYLSGNINFQMSPGDPNNGHPNFRYSE